MGAFRSGEVAVLDGLAEIARIHGLQLSRTPKRPAESSGDASSPQGDSDAPVAFFPAAG
jgi:hypothetical protein